MPDENITIGGSGANRTLTITPAENENGAATITVTVGDGTLTATDTFVLTVNAVNDPPTISVIGDVSIDENGVTLPLAFTIGDPDTAVGSLVVTGESGNDSLVPDADVVIAGAGSNWTVTVTPTADASGQATITVTVQDGSGGTTTEDFTVTVAVHDQPVAQDDVVALINALLPIDVLDNDSGLSDGPLTIEIIGSEGGAEVNVVDNTISIASLLDLDSDGSITFQYKVTDNDGDFAVGTVTVDLGL